MKRPFEALSVRVLGAQSYTEEQPPIATWRCNLTALSQLHNLYFVASQEKIYVYEPQFPAQNLSLQPVLILHCSPSRPGLPGSIDLRQPRCINYLVVQLLGDEEILAVARDDGDVDAFMVKHILSAMENRVAAQGISLLFGMKPFFQRNVGRSAWGLAIHSAARMIAVSANTHTVTIFKFGLVADEASGFEGRASDVSHNVKNGNANIPSIAFCNTGDDPEGLWLLTTDVSGHCCCINTNTMLKSPIFTFDGVTNAPDGFDPINAGWLVMFLDRRSFIREVTVDAALGIGLHDALSEEPDGTWWDISATVADVSNRAVKFVKRSVKRVESSTNVAVTEVSGSDRFRILDDAERENLPDEFGSDEDESEWWEDMGYKREPIVPSRSLVMLHASRSHGQSAFVCPILHTSFKSAYLLQPLQTQSSTIVRFDDALRQYTRPSVHDWPNAFDRLNMTAYIPSIGVLVLASQKGRAVILSLTKVNSHIHINYAMRIEHILPFAEQDKTGERPFAPLLGIAVGPMQGTDDLPDERKRWRLMMYYRDHSVLSYEIARPRKGDPSAVFETVVV